MTEPIAEIMARLDAILAALNKPDPQKPDLDDDLWTIAHVARYLTIAHTTARDKVVRRSSFPKPRKIVTDNGTMKRWSRDAVKAWAERDRD